MHWFVNIYFNMADKSSAKTQRDRKPNFTQEEVNVIQDQVQKNYKVINEKFGDGITNSRKIAVWSRISILVSALGVANRSPKDCKDKWANTKKVAKKVFNNRNKEQRATGGGPQPKKLSLAIERTIDLCKDSASFKGLEGVESVLGMYQNGKADKRDEEIRPSDRVARINETRQREYSTNIFSTFNELKYLFFLSINNSLPDSFHLTSTSFNGSVNKVKCWWSSPYLRYYQQ
ncbi:uncharacterized protein [Mytilus edulis]|uniref:uncharacterized protein n=1 Tax=Mytilus edulis TaxID=6550 RepID=UPI0039EF7411